MATRILNTSECGYVDFFSIGNIIWANGPLGSRVSDRLEIQRVIILQDATTKVGSTLFGKIIYKWDVDLDIFLENGVKIEVHTTDEAFLRKVRPYVWELQKKNPRVGFYEREQKRGLTAREKEGLVILTQQLENEKLLYARLVYERDQLMQQHNWEDIEVQKQQKKVLAAEKRIWNLQKRIDKLRERA